MNDIDKELEEFKDNLVSIDKISKELKENNNNLLQALKNTLELEKIKERLESEVENIKKVNGEYLKQMDKIYNEIMKRISEQDKGILLIQNKLSTVFKLEIALISLIVLIIVLFVVKIF